jgi:hypothetical protein
MVVIVKPVSFTKSGCMVKSLFPPVQFSSRAVLSSAARKPTAGAEITPGSQARPRAENAGEDEPLRFGVLCIHSADLPQGYFLSSGGAESAGGFFASVCLSFVSGTGSGSAGMLPGPATCGRGAGGALSGGRTILGLLSQPLVRPSNDIMSVKEQKVRQSMAFLQRLTAGRRHWRFARPSCRPVG